VGDSGRTKERKERDMSEKLTMRWDDQRIEDMARRGMEEEKFDTLSDYVRAAIVRDRAMAGDKDAKAIVKENIWKWMRRNSVTKRLVDINKQIE
jgi:Arc/MetJ-type ribon-helix-helix transcriptional regulator